MLPASATLTLKRPTPPKAAISLVPMIDVMLILLVFFMVTSTYLNLDMIPAANRSEAAQSPSTDSSSASSGAVLIRLAADGTATFRGQTLTDEAFAALVQQRPDARILILPSGAADMQALVTLMDAASRAGATNVSVVRLEASP
ncbi:ExbD/TolR family protein [Marivita hallyeonensis]|uniref:Biopolymer transport protein ExbD n=1 Tax=Marivita hallyeonensis TaxID=996342 RepID=A0A1M5PGK9_9RHOB|nr:biopolymer transporter ExbD [Marivita hallyeonensis]SHH00936.1 biopolymer transport protein ExbD [Marivita hallyeonensis]